MANPGNQTLKSNRQQYKARTGAIESVIAVLMNLLKTLDRPNGNVEPPNKLKKTVFRVTSGPGLEKNSANASTKWNS